MAGTDFVESNWSVYDSTTFSNPDSALSDFPLVVDIANLTSTFGSNVQFDGADIRITKSDGTTELAYDLIDWVYNSGSPTGKIRIHYSGTMASTGTQGVRIYAGYKSGTAIAYDADETYGRESVYKSTLYGYHPKGGGDDRTDNNVDLTSAGGISVGGVVGQIGSATDYDGSTQYSYFNNPTTTGAPVTLSAWFNGDTATSGYVAALADSSTSSELSGAAAIIGSDEVQAIQSDGGFDIATASTDSNIEGSWHHITAIFTSATSRKVVYDGGVSSGTNTGTNEPSDIDIYSIGASQDTTPVYFDGKIQEVQIWSETLSDDWISQEYDQTNDNSTFWGTWASTTISTGAVPTRYYDLFLKGVA